MEIIVILFMLQWLVAMLYVSNKKIINFLLNYAWQARMIIEKIYTFPEVNLREELTKAISSVSLQMAYFTLTVTRCLLAYVLP